MNIRHIVMVVATLFGKLHAEDLPDEVHPIPPEIKKASEEYNIAKLVMRSTYRKSFSEVFKNENISVEVLKLSDDMISQKKFSELETEGKVLNYLLIRPYGNYSKVVKSVKIQNKKKKELLTALKREFCSDQKNQPAFGHTPSHGIRIKHKNTLVYETSLCWKTNSFFVAYPDQLMTANWECLQEEALKGLILPLF